MVLPMLMGGGTPAASYVIANSARFNGTSAYLSRTAGVASTGAGKTVTISFWAKRCKLGVEQDLYWANSPRMWIYWGSNDKLRVGDNSFDYFAPNDVHRDTTAWYHIVVVFDTGNATATSRIKVYVNGTQLANTSANNPTQNLDTGIVQNGNSNYIFNDSRSFYVRGYLADFYLIDGQALTPSSFGKTDSNGVWVPIKYSGAYGTNGFKLEFKNSGALGTDTSGNGNNWTVNSLTSADQMPDTPSNNYCILSAIDASATAGTLSNGGLSEAAVTGNPHRHSTFGMSSGKWYWEATGMGGGAQPGIEPSGINLNPNANGWMNDYPGRYSNSYGVYTSDGHRYNNGSDGGAYISGGITTTDVVMFAFDADNGKFWMGKNGTWGTNGGVGDPAAGTNAMYTGISTFPQHAVVFTRSGTCTVNFGQSAFSYTPPTGFKTLCTANLPSVAVTTSGTFYGNANADGPVIQTNGNPATLTINGNAVTFGTHADKIASGFKLRSSSTSYNTSGSNTWTATAGKRFVYSSTSINNAQGNP